MLFLVEILPDVYYNDFKQSLKSMNCTFGAVYGNSIHGALARIHGRANS